MSKNTNTLDIVVGAQFGSEAKGHTVEELAKIRQQQFGVGPLVIRVAGPNAGHTGYDKNGRAWPLRQVPVAAVIEGPALLGIAPGSEIDPDVLLSEVGSLAEAGLLDRKALYVSEEATIIDQSHKDAEARADLVGRAGSTGKGIGAARADRLMRRADRLADRPELMDDLEDIYGADVYVVPSGHWDPAGLGVPVIVEGTQGYGLGLHAGYYPQCTSSDTRAIDFLAMAGISPWSFEQDKITIWATARVYPIRVAGNSGELKNETTWEDLGLPEEKTTVTQKVRRVGQPDWDLVSRAVRANGPGNVVISLTMTDQLDPAITGATSQPDLTTPVLRLIREVEETTGAPVHLVGTGPQSVVWLNKPSH